MNSLITGLSGRAAWRPPSQPASRWVSCLHAGTCGTIIPHLHSPVSCDHGKANVWNSLQNLISRHKSKQHLQTGFAFKISHFLTASFIIILNLLCKAFLYVLTLYATFLPFYTFEFYFRLIFSDMRSVSKYNNSFYSF